VFFWIDAGGGLLLAISVFYDPRGITAIGGLVLFVLGVSPTRANVVKMMRPPTVSPSVLRSHCQ